MQWTKRGYSLTSEHIRAPLARLKPTGDTDKVQVVWRDGQRWASQGRSAMSS